MVTITMPQSVLFWNFVSVKIARLQGSNSHDDGEKDTRSPFLEQDVCQGLKDRVWYEEDGECCVVLARCEVKVFGQAVYFGIADVCSIEEGDEV
jgi:hypothetical protein